MLTQVVDVPYINDNWNLKEFKELKKENKQHMHTRKERDYVTK